MTQRQAMLLLRYITLSGWRDYATPLRYALRHMLLLLGKVAIVKRKAMRYAAAAIIARPYRLRKATLS